MYEAFAKRKLIESLERRKLAIIGGLHGNMMGGDDLRKAIESIENNFDEAVATIYGRAKEEEEPIAENPFLSAMKLPRVHVTDADKLRIGSTEVDIEVDQD